jgi:hypothetical protein
MRMPALKLKRTRTHVEPWLQRRFNELVEAGFQTMLL